MPDVTVKDVVADLTPAPDDQNSPHGTFEVILSSPVIDRDGETINPDEWEQPLPDHITFDIDHGMSVASTVGSGTPSLDEHGNLRVRGSYASTDLAQTTRALVTEGHIRTTSVAFLRKQNHKSDAVRRELLNGAFVAVPANPAALVLTSKTATDDPRTTNGGDARTVQAIHDYATQYGADCPGQPSKDAAPVSDAQREQLAQLDTKALPEVVRAVLTALGVIDPDDDEPSAASDSTDDPAEHDAANPAAFPQRAKDIRALAHADLSREV